MCAWLCACMGACVCACALLCVCVCVCLPSQLLVLDLITCINFNVNLIEYYVTLSHVPSCFLPRLPPTWRCLTRWQQRKHVQRGENNQTPSHKSIEWSLNLTGLTTDLSTFASASFPFPSLSHTICMRHYAISIKYARKNVAAAGTNMQNRPISPREAARSSQKRRINWIQYDIITNVGQQTRLSCDLISGSISKESSKSSKIFIIPG